MEPQLIEECIEFACNCSSLLWGTCIQ